jgi:hypothetical protein
MIPPQFGSFDKSSIMDTCCFTEDYTPIRLLACWVECLKTAWVYIPVAFCPSIFVVVAFGQFLIPIDESFRFVYWIAELVFAISFGVLSAICCHKSFVKLTFFMVFFMFFCSFFGLLKSLNIRDIVDWSWLWIFSPLFAIPICLLVWFCYMCRPGDNKQRV